MRNEVLKASEMCTETTAGVGGVEVRKYSRRVEAKTGRSDRQFLGEERASYC
jgi:hypothetical protein